MTTPSMPPPPGMPPPPAMPQPEGPKQRPVTVTLAAGIMMLIGALSLVSAVISLAAQGTIKERMRENLRAIGTTDTIIDQQLTGITIGNVVGIGFSVVVVLAITALALLNLRGNNVSRIITWVLCGLFLLCSVCSLAALGATSALTGGAAGQAINDAISNSYPGWYIPTTTALGIVQALCYVAVIVLLLLGPSNEYFRKTPPAFQPPVSGAGM